MTSVDQPITEPDDGATVGLVRGLELTILMPCLDEAATLGGCISEADGFLRRTGVHGEILVADNGSTDGSQAIAAQLGARVVQVEERGYGETLRAGMREARGTFVIMADSDASYDFANLDTMLDGLRSGSDLVVGNRFAGGIEPGAMPTLNRYVGNPVLSHIARRLFSIPVRDFHCGLRGVRSDTAGSLPYRSPGMEFASEMIIRCSFAGLEISEVSTTLRPDGRERAPHLRRWRDGWRHLSLLLLYSPRWLFLYPGALAVLMAAVLATAAIFADTDERGVRLGVASLGLFALGMQAICFAVVSKVWGARLQLLPSDIRVAQFVAEFRLGRMLGITFVGLVVGALLLGIGLSQSGIDAFDILAVGVVLVSVQLALNSALVSMSTL